MKNKNIISGFSKLSRESKLEILKNHSFIDDETIRILNDQHFSESRVDVEGFTENVISTYKLPFSIVPNVLINNKMYAVPMVIEESSVVAAASSSAKFWAAHGGFKTKLVGETKIGQLHFEFDGDPVNLKTAFKTLKPLLVKSVEYIQENMKKRGGGLQDIELLDYSEKLPNYYQLRVSFLTSNAMGANFINSCLEKMGDTLVDELSNRFPNSHAEVIMAILSNYTPDCAVVCTVETDIEDLKRFSPDGDAHRFADRFRKAVEIAEVDPYRAVTHNKGIYNGIDSVVLATANDFRAIEACGHAWASEKGKYKSLSYMESDSRIFRYTMKIPLALGSVGGLTTSHPMARAALDIMGNPGAGELMQIAVAMGMANNFSAVKALTTSGIQKGHMKMHLNKILLQLGASEEETQLTKQYFADKTISHREVVDFIEKLRS